MTLLEMTKRYFKELRLEVTVDAMTPEQLETWGEIEGIVLDKDEAIFIEIAKAKSESGETAYYAVLYDTSNDDGSKTNIREEGIGFKYHPLQAIELAAAALLQERSVYAGQVVLSEEVIDEVISEEE